MRLSISFIIVLISSSIIFAQDTIAIKDIVIAGNKITKKEVIIRELLFRKGDIISYKNLNKKITKSKENLTNLKLFNFIDINYNSFIDGITININVTERWYLWPYPILEVSERNFNSWWKEFQDSQYSDFSRLNYGIFLNWENFRGKNELIKIKFRKGFKEHFLFTYEVPYINKMKTFGINTNLQLFRRKKSFYKTEKNLLVYHTDDDKFTTKDYEFHTEIIHRKGTKKTHKIKFHYFMSNADSTIVNSNPNYFRNNLNEGSYSKLTYEYIDENRDYIVYPLKGYYIQVATTKYFQQKSPVNHFEIIGEFSKHLKIKDRLFIGSSAKGKWSSEGYQPYFAQEGFGFDDYVRGYEYYVIDGQDIYMSKTILKFALIKKTKFDIPYIRAEQFNKSHYSLYLGLFNDLGFSIDNQNEQNNTLNNKLLWGKGISLDYVTYYDKLLRIEFSINHLGEKGVFLHFSNPFGSKNKL